MANPKYQSYQPSAPPPDTVIRTTNDGAGEVQHVALSDAAGMPLVVTGANTGERGLRVYGGPTDPISDIPVYIDLAHHQVHEGETHIWSVLVSSLGLNANKDIRLVVPAGLTPTTKTPHLEYEIITTGEAEVYFYEATTYTAPGNQVTSLNRNRNSITNPAMTIFEDPTVNAVGTLLWIGLTGSGTKAGGGDRGLSEFDLAANQVYNLRVTSRAAGNKVLIRLNFYEDLGV